MKTRSALILSLARERHADSTEVHKNPKKKSIETSEPTEIEEHKIFQDCMSYYTDKKNVYGWIDSIPSRKVENKITIFSDILIKEGTSIQEPKAVQQYIYNNTTESIASIISATIDDNSEKSNGSIASVDDSIKDPDYVPCSDTEMSCEIPIQDIMVYQGDNIRFDETQDNNDVENDPIPPVEEYRQEAKEECLSLTKVPVEPVETAKKTNYADKKNYCIYCDKDVTHFVRHVFTWHSSETTVQRILSLPAKSRDRRNVISSLRKRGNFVKSRGNETLRPVKRIKVNDKSSIDEFLPCSHCFGFYKKKSLYRHTKKCPENSETRSGRQTSQSDGHTLLLTESMKYDQLLTKELFPRMRPDKINLVAKKDSLICQYAYSYLKGRKSKGNLDVVRQNMRKLSKLLDFAKQREPGIKELIDILKPIHFSLILNGVKVIAKYNVETDLFESPTLAINFGTLLKKCCDLAYLRLIQIDGTEDQRKDLKILKRLIESQWADEISAQACHNLNENKWNKSELLPLTSDLKKLSIFLQTEAEEYYKLLQNGEKNYSAYNNLKEIVYSQIILLNRRRPAEVAQLKVNKYNSIINSIENSSNTEFESCLSETEKILLHSYSRIVIRGKRGRGVPILLSPQMKKHFDFLISIRNHFVEENQYIFHTGGRECLDGTKILYKWAERCGIDNPRSISATKLRKHLATITQLLQFSEKDLEQLSRFMGHTLRTHCNVYRLSDNLYQTAKVSKLLLLMSEGGVEQFKGKNLDEIDIDLNPLVEEETILIKRNVENEVDDEPNEVNSMPSPKNNIRRKPVIKHPWSNNEKQLIAQYFSDHIKNKRPPKQREVEQLLAQNPGLFQNRKWSTIKAVVYNMYTGKLNWPFKI